MPSGMLCPEARVTGHPTPATQLLPQATWPGGHSQVPPWQTPPSAHAVPQPPQLERLVFGFTQALPHAMSPAWGQEHVPVAQAVVGDVHAVPQPPQFAGSLDGSTQELPQQSPGCVPNCVTKWQGSP